MSISQSVDVIDEYVLNAQNTELRISAFVTTIFDNVTPIKFTNDIDDSDSEMDLKYVLVSNFVRFSNPLRVRYGTERPIVRLT